jgi:hypothetical protein
MASLGVVSHTLASAVADDATVAIAYPTGETAESLRFSTGGDLTVGDGKYGSWEQADPGFSVAYGASTITITNLSGLTWPAGEVIRVSFGTNPYNGSYNPVAGIAKNQFAAGNQDGISQELTASGAIDSNVRNIRLNHASVVIAATFTPKPGLVTITDVSATGTAAHTVTLGGGATFNGTNTIATLNALAESLVVFFDNNLAGTVVVNTGSVALSGP